MKILILGSTGMLGSAIFNYFTKEKLDVWGTARTTDSLKYFHLNQQDKIIIGIDVLNQDNLVFLLNKVRPNLVINCVGVIKQQGNSKDPLIVLPINSMLPHRLSDLCEMINARMIHVSTDCVFSGNKGMYVEEDISDAEDLYGKSKYIGEVKNKEHVLTIRTSIIGHELNSRYSLIDWFLSQEGKVSGFSKAIFSGLPTIELAKIIKKYIIPNSTLSGMYHISAEPIDKHELLNIVKLIYKKDISIVENKEVILDRSLNSSKFRIKTGYNPPNWNDLIKMMFEYKVEFMDIDHVR